MEKQTETDDTRKLGWSMLIGMWVLIFLLLGWLFNGVVERMNNPNQQVETRYIGQQREVSLQRNRSGHYVSSGMINQQPVEFILDTGATGVIVPMSMADRLGLTAGAEMYAHTANGVISVYEVRLKQVSIGGIELKDVKAMLNPQEKTDTVLLGMSFLKHIEFTQRGDSLILRQY